MAWFCALLLLWLTAHGPPGPNSGHLHPNLFATEWSLEMRGEGFGSPMGADGEGGSCWSPIYAPQTYMGKGTKGSFGTVSQLPIAMKRSLRRATKRANQFGWSVYKGHILRGQTMSQIRHVDWQQLEPSDLARAKSTPWRAALVSWNCGGLTTELYQEILEWLRLHNITIMFLQGTRWREDRVWTVGDYSVIQSGEEFGPHHTHAGLLTFISKKFCNADDISYAVVDPGRILHVKCRIGAKSIDLINVYQHPEAVTKTRHKPGEARALIWHKLDGLLHGLAHRNILCMGGDFNCSLPGHGPKPSNPSADVEEFAGLLRKYHCHTVRSHDGIPSFIGATGRSTIDFVFMRSSQMDRPAHNGHCLQEFPLAAWRTVVDHRPILVSLPLTWTCWHAKPPQPTKLKRHTQENMYYAWRRQTPSWTQVQTQLRQLCEQMPSSLNAYPKFAQDVIDLCSQSFTAGTRASFVRPHQSIVAQLWMHYRQLRQSRLDSLASIFQAWVNFRHVMTLKAQLSKACREAKKARLQHFVTQAQEAADLHDSRKLHSIIRELAPKQPFRLIRLKGHHGAALSAPSECQMLESHFAAVFQTSHPYDPPSMQPLVQMPFTFDELFEALAKAPIGKAVAPSTLPNLIIRSLAFEFADWLWTVLENLWMKGNPMIPQQWKDAWLSLLAKRAVRQPKDVRPIALTDGLGKIVLGLLTAKLKPITYPLMRTLPIFAFIPNRGTEEALMFVFYHCRKVRDACTTNARSFWSRHAGHPQTCLAGGAILSLDMSQAFDRLPRERLHQGFQLAGVPEDLSLLFEHWLKDARYHIHHRGIDCAIDSSRGVRQGCKASPLEWSLFLCALIHALDEKMPYADAYSWAKEHLITYADDLITLWCLQSHADVSDMLQQIGILLDTLELVGMQVNLDKTAFLIRLSGRKASGILKKLIVKQPTGRWIRIPRQNNETTLLRVVDAHTYLGTTISFFSFEDQTLSHRLKVGRATFLRLRAWLLRRHTYPLALRIQLWVCCVRASYLYGLQAVGLTQRGLNRLHRRFVSEIRSIARSPSHITHESTAALCARLGLPLPTDHLRAVWQHQYERRCTKWEGLQSDDFLAPFDIHEHYKQLMQVFEHSTPAAALDEVQLCPYCDFSTQYPSQLTKHLQKRHLISKTLNQFVCLRDANAGLPKCAHCSRIFSEHAGLKRHIVKNSCQQFVASRPWQVALADDPRLRALALQEDWRALWTDAELLGLVRTQCVLCNQVMLSTKQLAEHLHKDHPAAWEMAQPYLAPHVAGGTGQPCKACGQRNARSHACPVLRQLAMITALQRKGQTVPDLQDQAPEAAHQGPPLSTPVKRQKTQDSQAGKDLKAEFHPARDSLGGLPQCAHCGQPAHSTTHLQRHIETGRCPSFDPMKPIGTHIPCTWDWLNALVTDEMPIPALEDEKALHTLCSSCVLCGQKLGHAKSILQHLHRDHDSMLERSLAAHADLLQYMIMHKRCCCTYVKPPADHKCPVHYQLLILRYLKDHPLQGLPMACPDTAELLQACWHDFDLRAKLTNSCSQCLMPVPPANPPGVS